MCSLTPKQFNKKFVTKKITERSPHAWKRRNTFINNLSVQE